MNALPFDIQWFIWRKMFKFVANEIVAMDNLRMWQYPSDRLVDLCRDNGAIQQGHHGLEDMIEDHDMWAYNICIDGHCQNCEYHGFPCLNLAVYGFNNRSIEGIWRPNFTVG